MTSYYALIHKDEASAYGVTFPDLPGCFSAGDTYEEAFQNAREALRLYTEQIEDAHGVLPPPRELDKLLKDKSVRAEAREAALVSVPVLADTGRTVRIAITLDAGERDAIDRAAKERGLTRSKFLINSALEKI